MTPFRAAQPEPPAVELARQALTPDGGGFSAVTLRAIIGALLDQLDRPRPSSWPSPPPRPVVPAGDALGLTDPLGKPTAYEVLCPTCGHAWVFHGRPGPSGSTCPTGGCRCYVLPGWTWQGKADDRSVRPCSSCGHAEHAHRLGRCVCGCEGFVIAPALDLDPDDG